MRVLLDENLDHRLRRSFDRSIEVATVAEQGWKGKRNSELLELASREFDAFIRPSAAAPPHIPKELPPAFPWEGRSKRGARDIQPWRFW